MKDLTQLDKLTGMPTKIAFEQQFYAEWQRAVRYKSALALIIIDIDYFEAFNRHYSIEKGDSCLKEVADRLKTEMRRSADLLVRYGDDDFAIVLPDTNQKGAMIVAEGIKKAIKEMKIPHEKSLISEHLTISMGVVSSFPSLTLRPPLMIDGALKALKNAKLGGRDLVRSAIIGGGSLP